MDRLPCSRGCVVYRAEDTSFRIEYFAPRCSIVLFGVIRFETVVFFDMTTRLTRRSITIRTYTPPTMTMGGNSTADDTSRFQRRMKRKANNILALEARVLEKREEVRTPSSNKPSTATQQHSRSSSSSTAVNNSLVSHTFSISYRII